MSNHTLDNRNHRPQQQQGRPNDRFQGQQPNQGKQPQERQPQVARDGNRLDNTITVGQWRIGRGTLEQVCKAIQVMSFACLILTTILCLGGVLNGCLLVANAVCGGGVKEGIIGGLVLVASLVAGRIGNRTHRWLSGMVSRSTQPVRL